MHIPEQTTSWISISRNRERNAFVDEGGLSLRVVINWSQSFWRTPAVRYIVSWPPSTLIWSYTHPIACCFLLMLLPVSCTLSKCASWAIISVGAVVVSRWTNSCLCCCCISVRGAFNEELIVRLDSDSITSSWGICGAMTCCCEKNDEHDYEKWKVQRNTY